MHANSDDEEDILLLKSTTPVNTTTKTAAAIPLLPFPSCSGTSAYRTEFNLFSRQHVLQVIWEMMCCCQRMCNSSLSLSFLLCMVVLLALL